MYACKESAFVAYVNGFASVNSSLPKCYVSRTVLVGMIQNNLFSETSEKASIPAIQEVEIIYSGPKTSKLLQVKSSTEVAKLLRDVVYDPRKINYKESFYVLLLNRANKVIAQACVGMGSTTATIMNGKEIFQLALKTNACGIILSHNHPSGNLKPSEADLSITKRIKEFGNMIDIQLLDHIILTDESYFSFADEGLI